MKRKQPICYIVGAALCDEVRFVPEAEDYVIAADGGLRYLEAAGIRADMVVGDFDTLGYEPDHDNVIRLQREKDWTDTFVAMEKGVELGYQIFVFYGCLGGKIEHTMANLQHLAWLSQRGLQGWMTDGRCWLTAISEFLDDGSGSKPDGSSACGRLVLPARPAGMVSVFCHSDRAEGVTIQGLKYTLQDAELTNGFPLGVSNEFVDERAEISVKKGTLLVAVEV